MSIVDSTTEAIGTRPGAQAILELAQEGRLVLEEFVPLADSLEFQLGQQYWRERGSNAFIGDATPVPYAINNDGSLSQRAAEVFFASLVEAEQQGPLEPVLYVLELGIGVGLFARFFLDAFKEICGREGKDYYRRLVYIAGDRSERMLADACRHGVFANHPGRYLIRVVDALEPGRYLLGDPALAGAGPRPLRAVFLNYVLDCLPAAHLRVCDVGPLTPDPFPPEGRGENDADCPLTPGPSPPEGRGEPEVSRLCVRTCLARHVNLGEHTRLTAADLVRRARSDVPADRRTLMELYGLFASEYDYRPIPDGETVPYLDLAVRVAREHKVAHLLHNHGAIQSVARLLDLLAPGGFLLVNDYGQVELKANEAFEHQRFSRSTSVGLNFVLLKAYFGEAGRCQWLEPDGENGHIYSRLLGCPLTPNPSPPEGRGDQAGGVGPATAKEFTERFGKAAWEWRQQPWNAARTNLQYGRPEAALASYHQAIERQPGNWLLLNETAWFLTYLLRNPRAGIAMAKAAVTLNPTCSSELWNTLGDAYYELGKRADAKSAYRHALRINPADVRGRYNLAWTALDERRYGAAMALIAEALNFDETGEYHERLVQKQNEVLARLVQRNRQRMFLLANRISSKPAPDTLLRVDAKHAPSANGEPHG